MPAMGASSGSESQDLVGKTYVITGATSGIGKVTALVLAKRGANLILANRSLEKTAPVVEEIKAQTKGASVEVVQLDLGDLASVRKCAETLLAKQVPIHGLINNAGLAGVKGVTKDGFEIQFGTNHLGHFLLTNLLLERIKESAPSRIVNVASKSHYQAKSIDWTAQRQPTKHATALPEYAVSKLANVLFTKELATRLAGTGVTAYSLHPGVVATDVWRKIPAPVRWIIKRFMISPERGAEATLRCATDPALASESGKYYDVGGVEKRPSRVAEDADLARTLWAKSTDWVGLPASAA